MLGLGLSLLKGAVVTALSYIKENLKLFFDFSDNSPELLFDGTTDFEFNDYVTVSDSDNDLDISGDLTITAWIKPEVGSANAFFIDKSDPSSTNTRNYTLYIRSTSSYLRFSSHDGSSVSHLDSSTALTDGEWYHVAISVKSGVSNGAKLYVNGVKENQDTRTINGTTSDLLFGKRSDNSLNYIGKMSSVGIWNRALSASEIESIKWRGKYSELSGTELTNLRGWWDLQGDVNDKSGNSNDGTNSNATLISNSYSAESPFKPRIKDIATPKDAVQLADGSTSFDGTDDYISIPDDNSLSFGDGSSDSAFSLSAWIKMDDATKFKIFAKGIYNTNAEYVMEVNSDDKLRLILYDEDVADTVEIAMYNTAITSYEGQWIHVCATYNGVGGTSANAGIKLYINGSNVATTLSDAGTYVSMVNGSADVHIGRDGSDYANGSIANATIHSSELTHSQVIELMFTEKYAGLSSDLKTNLVSWYDMGSDQLSGTELITNGNFNTDVSSWSSDNSGLITSQDNGVNGTKCLRIQKNGDTNPLAYQDFTTVVGQKYRITYYVKAGTEASSQVAMGEADYSNRTFSGVVETPAEWTQRTHDHIATGTTSRLLLYLSNDDASGSETIFYDDVSVQKIEVPDSEGTNDGNVFGATTTTGYTSSPHGVVDPLNFGEVYSGRSLYFGGATEHSDIGDISATMYAMSFWFNSNSDISASSGLGHPICLTDDHSYGGIYFGGWTGSIANEMISIVGNSGGNRNYYASATDVILDDMWHHLGITWDSSNSKYKIYLDGVELSVATEGSMSPIVCDYVMLGRRYSEHHPYHGLLKTIKIFNTSLTESQLQELYTNPEQILPTGISASSLKLDLPMQEGSGDYIYDGSGNGNHGTLTGATWQTGEKDGYQTALVRSNTPMIFDGNNDYIDCGNGTALDITSNLSMSLWVKINDGSSTQFLMGRDNDTQRNWELGISSNKLFFGIFSSNSNQGAGGLGNTLSDNVWYHIVATYDGSNQKTYVNGSLTSTTSGSGSIDNDNVSLTIGARPNGDRYFDGIINEVGLWNVALDADAVTALYNSGVPLLPTSDSGNYDNSSALQGYWRNDGLTWTDRSTNSNNGTASGSPVTIVIPEGSTSGRDNQGFLLSNTHQNSLRLHDSEYVNVQESEALSFGDGNGDTPFSVEAWIKMDSAVSFPIMTKGVYNTNAEWQFLTESDSKLYFNIFDESVASCILGRKTASTLESYEGTWVHVVGTYDASGADTGLKLYVNGAQVSDATNTGNAGSYVAIENLGTDIYIGRLSSTYAKGLISQPRIYSKELSASEVLNNYNYGQALHQ